MASPMHARRAKLKSQLVSAKAKLKHHVTPRRLLLLSAAAASAFLLLLTLRTLSAAAANTSSPAPVVVHRSQQQQRDDQCDRVPAGVAEALVHYATSNATAWGRGRRRSAEEVAATARAVSRRAPCNLLVFGLGHGAALWAALNHGGRTVFLEEDDALVSGAHPASLAIEAYRFSYLASAADADELLALRELRALHRRRRHPALAGPLRPLAVQARRARLPRGVLRGGVGRDRGRRARAAAADDDGDDGRDIHRGGGGAGAAAGGGDGDGRGGARRGQAGAGQVLDGVPVRRLPQGGGWQPQAIRHP
ncbi:hypothetical protein OsJ_33499 [Oryza sativa Japonica Group]|uniref:Uncharacterized protein n=1 Tax=Oryza sativa subsp. japonica TaxID=39947 RepID=A3CA42_ORYSJ|nr:hypothetical protein OsJ_33499 [Oryza sativa Japonica Group]